MRKKKFVGWLRNHTSHDDDESMVVWAYTKEDAQTEIMRKMDKSRFSLRTVFTAAEARQSWA